ncbi:hypothetical protein AGOR_G00044470 [Albula goreensis]|uniref:Anillin n=1 Tax=Albula goreensis TaxID=1534307 RepID=A0A8T3E168_9TELE|nr:hypothetical protein AGOR_G00044470 [Albula goreensis]
MDPFTEKLLERTRARRENLQKKMADRPTPANRQMAKRSREPLAEANGPGELTTDTVAPATKPSPSKRRCSAENDRPVAGAENREPAVTTAISTAPEPQTDKKPPMIPAAARPAPEPERKADTDDGTAQPPSGMRSRLQRLAEQRQHWDTDAPMDSGGPAPLSPVRTQKQEAIATVTVASTPVSTETPVGRRGRLANLAATIGTWEDDLARPAQWADKAQAQPGTANCAPPTVRASAKPSSDPAPPRNQSPLKSKVGLPEARSAPQVGSGVSPSPQKSFASGGAAGLHSGRALAASPQRAGPSQFSVSRTPPKSQAPTGQLPLGPRPSPSKPELLAKPVATATATPTALQPRGSATGATAPGGPGVKSFLERFGERCQERSTKNSPSSTASTPASAPGPRTPTAAASITPNTRLVQERLKNTQVVTATADLALKQKQDREKELAQIRNRFQKGNVWKNSEKDAENKEKAIEAQPEEEPTAPPVDTMSMASKSSPAAPRALERAAFAPEKRSGESGDEGKEEKEVHAAEEEVVREVEMNVDESNSSEVINQLFEDVLEESKEQIAEEEEEEDEEEEGGEEDALNISSMSLLTPLAETVAAVTKSPELKLMTSTPASSFCEKRSTPDASSRHGRFQRARVLRGTEEEDAAEDDQNLPYSIDAYRSTRIKETERPRVQQIIVRKEDVSQRGEEPAHSNHVSIKQRMKVLTNEMNLQQTVIHQASQALNCCTDEEHGKGSQVEAEAERLLLIATERRSALKAELDRLKGEGPAGQKKGSAPSKAQDDTGVPASKGTVSLHELRLPLKADFVCAAANKPESANYYFFVMIRAGAENTVATPLASTRSALSGDALTFSTKFTLPDVSNDFEIDVEVYCLVQKREPYTDKRKKPSKSKAITPKRLLTSITKSGLQTPAMASPGGPNAVRTSNFTLVGSHKLTLASIGKNKFPLEKMNIEVAEQQLLSDMFQYKVPFLCPLEGHVYLKLHCEVGSRIEEKGFLTMFEDVSGFGAWHRRWCVLSGYCISYWTYPDDEKRKMPIGWINLANCTSRKVEPANREFCARPNTFELITVRPQREDDKETLVSRCKNTMCVTKNWLSADTKDERNLWMQKLNQILVDLRMWQPDSCYRPL